MPIECGHRLAASFPNSRFVEIPDSGTLIPLDQPQLLARAISVFVVSGDRQPAQ
jgi:pimeloyl-ACP methyl ester carboxylesterase